MVCAVTYPNDITGIDLLAEIEDCHSLIHTHDAITVPTDTPIDVLRFITVYGVLRVSELVHNPTDICSSRCRLSVTSCSCERSFPKHKIDSLVSAQQYVIIKTKLRWHYQWLCVSESNTCPFVASVSLSRFAHAHAVAIVMSEHTFCSILSTSMLISLSKCD